MSTLYALKEDLIEADPEFRDLYNEHQACETKLTEIAQKALLSQEDEMEEKKIKRHKLFLKDQMAALMREQRAGAEVSA